MGQSVFEVDPTGVGDYAEARTFVQTDADQELADKLQRLFKRASDARASLDRTWDVYRLYLQGEHHIYRDTTTGELVRVIDQEQKRLYSVNNQFGVVVRALAGKVARDIPDMKMKPPSAAERDVQAARTADAFFAYADAKEGLKEKWARACYDMAWSGIGLVGLFWNKYGGREFARCTCGFTGDADLEDTKCPQCAKSMLVLANEGDFEVHNLDPRDLYIEPGKLEPDDLTWAFHRQALPVTEIRAMFPRFATVLQEESDIYADTTVRKTYSTSAGSWSSAALEDHAYLYQYIEKPTLLYPKGRVVFMCNGIILDERDSPYAGFGRLPFFWVRWEPTPGDFYPTPVSAHLWHRQKELNELETQVREHIELLSRTKVLLPHTARVGAQEITATTAQTITYNALGRPPEYMTPPAMPPAVYERRATLISDMQSLASVTGAEMGMVGSDPNGRAMAILNAEADQSLGLIQRRNYREYSQLHRCLLQLVHGRYAPDRKFSILGDLGLEVYSFQDLNNASGPGFIATFEMEDGLSKNQSLRLREVLELANAGIFGNPATGLNVSAIAAAARLKVPGILPDPSSPEIAAAQAKIQMIEDGLFEQVELGIEDDPMIHANIMTAWLRGPGRRAEPPIRQAVRQLLMFYMQAISAGMQSVMMQTGETPLAGIPTPLAGSMPGSDVSAPGGSPSNPVSYDTGQSIAKQAGADVAAADMQGEMAAMAGAPHEG